MLVSSIRFDYLLLCVVGLLATSLHRIYVVNPPPSFPWASLLPVFTVFTVSSLQNSFVVLSKLSLSAAETSLLRIYGVESPPLQAAVI